MKHLILSSLLVATLSVAAAENKKSIRSTKSSNSAPVTRNESTSTQTQIITKDGKTDGTVTVTINKDGKTEVKTWKIGGGASDSSRAGSFKPSNSIQLRSVGKMEKVTWLGVAVTEISEDLASQLPLPDGVGLRVRQVIGDSPAAQAGLQTDDLITQLDQQLIFNVQQFQSLTRTFKSGEEVEVTYYRKGKKRTATAKLATKEMMVNQTTPFPSPQWLDLRKHPSTSKAWTSVLEHRAKAEAQRKQAIDAANKAREAVRAQSWIHDSTAGKRAIIVRPDGQTTVVRTEEQIRGNIRKQVLQALKDAGVSDKVVRDTLKAFDRGLEGYPRN